MINLPMKDMLFEIDNLIVQLEQNFTNKTIDNTIERPNTLNNDMLAYIICSIKIDINCINLFTVNLGKEIILLLTNNYSSIGSKVLMRTLIENLASLNYVINLTINLCDALILQNLSAIQTNISHIEVYFGSSGLLESFYYSGILEREFDCTTKTIVENNGKEMKMIKFLRTIKPSLEQKFPQLFNSLSLELWNAKQDCNKLNDLYEKFNKIFHINHDIGNALKTNFKDYKFNTKKHINDLLRQLKHHIISKITQINEIIDLCKISEEKSTDFEKIYNELSLYTHTSSALKQCLFSNEIINQKLNFTSQKPRENYIWVLHQIINLSFKLNNVFYLIDLTYTKELISNFKQPYQ